MISRCNFHVLLTLLLLFGQFSSLAHALEHLSFPEGAEPCQIWGEGPDTHQVLNQPHHDADNQNHGHHVQDSEFQNSGLTFTQNVENIELETCLIYHLHGSMQVAFKAELKDTDFYAYLCTVYTRKNDTVIPVFTTLYDSRGPPADV
jgi:hypothetical protein